MIKITQEGDLKIPELKKDMENIFINNGKEIGEEAVKFFKASFNIKGFINQSLNRWKPRIGKETNPMMIKTGALERSIKVGNINKKSIEVVSEGLDYNVKMNEEREFIGNSKELEDKILKNKIESIVQKIINKYK